MRGLPLGTILYRQGLVEQTDLEEALAAGMESGERLGEVLIRRELVSEDQIGHCLAAQQGLEFLNEDDFSVDHEALALIPTADARSLGAIAVAVSDGAVLVLTPDPSAHQRARLGGILHRPMTQAVVSRPVFENLVARAEAPAPEPTPTFALQAVEDVEVVEPAPVDAFSAEPSELHPLPADDISRPEPEEDHMENVWSDADLVASGEEAHEPFSPVQVSDEIWDSAAVEPEQDAGEEVAEHDAGEEVVAEQDAAEETTEQPVGESFSDEAPEEQHWVGEEPAAAPVNEWAAEPQQSDSSFEEEVVRPVELHELGSQHEASVGRIDELLARIHEGATTYSSLRAQITGLTESLHSTEEALADRERRLGELTEAHESAQRRIDELTGELGERERDLSGLGEKLEDLTGRLGSAEQRLDEREQRLAELDASLAERVRIVEELSAQVERRDSALSSFEEKLAAIASQFVADGTAG